MKIVCISDTHKYHHKVDLPDGDVLVHAGDLTARGAIGDLNNFAMWLHDLDFEHKVVIAGNHDFCFEDERRGQAINILTSGRRDVHYLENEGIEIGGKYFWGSPQTLFFNDWAFNVKGEDNLMDYFERIPEKTDVLITHGPPYEVLDEVKNSRPNEDPHVGSVALKERVHEVVPDLHVFGHIHEDYGELSRYIQSMSDDDYNESIKFVNASICNLDYNAVNDPVVVEV
jgi:Icc-related predicted phosphoesterase